MKILIVVIWLALFLVLERVSPAVQRTGNSGRGRLWRNAGLWLTSTGASRLAVLPVTIAAASITLWQRPDWWAGWQGLLLDLLLLDFFIYWWHRANHEIPFLWRFHAVHHLDRHLDATSALRFHFGEVVLSAGARAIFIIAMGMPLESVLIFETLLLMAAIWHHSNIRLPGRIDDMLAHIIITPGIHRMHHHAMRTDTDSCYGLALSLWDRLFGTARARHWQPDMSYGVDAGAGQKAEDESLLRLLLRPFRKQN